MVTKTTTQQTIPGTGSPVGTRSVDAPPAMQGDTQQDQTKSNNGQQNGESQNANEPRLPPSVVRRGIDEPTWRTLCNSVFPGALGESILMAVDYCRARNLDVLKKPCHIVGMSVKEKRRRQDGSVQEVTVWRDVILPGIYEYRVTAHRTAQYLGHTKPEYGPIIEFVGVKAPQWCSMTMRRWHPDSQQVVEYPVEVDFSEVVATKNDGNANARWTRAPKQMLRKCTEAAGLREAFPDELGGTHTDDELGGKVIDITPARSTKPTTEAPRAIESERPALANDDQIKLIRAQLSDHEIAVSDACGQFQIEQLEALQFDQVQEMLDWIAKLGR